MRSTVASLGFGLSLGLVAQAIQTAGSTQSESGCTTTLENGFANPSFEAGSVAGWTIGNANGYSVNGGIATFPPGIASDGSYL